MIVIPFAPGWAHGAPVHILPKYWADMYGPIGRIDTRVVAQMTLVPCYRVFFPEKGTLTHFYPWELRPACCASPLTPTAPKSGSTLR